MFQLNMFLFNALLFTILTPIIIYNVLKFPITIIINIFGIQKYGNNSKNIIIALFHALLFATIWHFTNKLVFKVSEGFYAVPAAAASLTPEQIAAAVAAVQAAAPAAAAPAAAPAAKAVSPALPPVREPSSEQGPSNKSSLSSLSTSKLESAKKALSDLTPAQRAELAESVNKN